jgi:hypothetical protein
MTEVKSVWFRAVILVLLAALLGQLYLYVRLTQPQRPLYLLMPFITPAQSDGQLPRTGLRMVRYLGCAGLLGPTLNLEDVRDGVRALALQPGLALTPAQQARIQPQLDRAAQAQAGIAALRTAGRAAETQLAVCQAEMVKLLTPAQRETLKRKLPPSSPGGPR